MAQLKLKQEITELLTGKPFPDTDLGKVICQALIANNPNENPSGDEKYNRWKLAARCADADAVEVSIEELALIKKVVGAAYGANVVGPVFSAIEAMSTGDGETKPPRP